MVVLDEQLKGYGLEGRIGRWHRGAVRTVKELRPGSVIKDDGITFLLRRESDPVFVTINDDDFWRVMPLSLAYCIVCFSFTTSEIPLISPLLRRLLTHPDFKTKAKRAGKAVHITAQGIATYYTWDDDTIREIDGF